MGNSSFPVGNLWTIPGTVHPSSTVYPTVYVQDMHSLYIYKAQLSHLVIFTALYSGKTYLTNHSISTRLFPIPLSDTLQIPDCTKNDQFVQPFD